MEYFKVLLGIMVALSTICFCGCGGEMISKQAKEYEDSLYSIYVKDSCKYRDEVYCNFFDEDTFVKIIQSDESTIDYPFTKLKEIGCVNIYTSTDSNLRIYTWVVQNCGFHSRYLYIHYLCQYKTKSGNVITTTDAFDKILYPANETENGFEGLNNLRLVCSVVNNAGIPIYIIEAFNIENQDGYYKLIPICIKGEHLVNCEIFPRKMGCMDVECYGVAGWYEQTGGFGLEWINSYDDKSKSLYVPHFPEFQKMDDRYDVYKFNRTSFEFVKTDGGFWLNPKVRSFKELKTVFKTKDYIIRVDLLHNGLYRYLSWGKGKTMQDEPDLELTTDEYDKVKHRFVFVKNDKGSYQYIVDDGFDGTSNFGLIVIKNGKVVLRQDRIM